MYLPLLLWHKLHDFGQVLTAKACVSGFPELQIMLLYTGSLHLSMASTHGGAVEKTLTSSKFHYKAMLLSFQIYLTSKF